MVCTNEGAQRKAEESARDECEREPHEVCGPRHEENREGNRRENPGLACCDAPGSDAERESAAVLDEAERAGEGRRADVLRDDNDDVVRNCREKSEDERA